MRNKDIIIEEAVFCIFDINLPFVNATQVHLGTDDAEGKYVYSLLTKYFYEVTSRKARIRPNDFMSEVLERGESPFASVVEYVANEIHAILKSNPDVMPGNGIFVKANMDEQEYIIFFKLNYQTKFICSIDEAGLVEWKRNNKILPSAGQKITEYFYLNLSNGYIRVSDCENFVDGHACNYLAAHVLKLTMGKSEKEMVETFETVVHETVKEIYEEVPQKLMEYRQTVAEIVQEKGTIDVEEFSQVFFADNEKAMEQCMEKAKEEELTERPITISKKMERQLNKKQKIVTESGIEIIVPIEYLQNNDVFEYVQDETGKVSIIIRDVGPILK